MRESLFDVLCRDGSLGRPRSDRDAVLRSVVRSLRRLFNARRGMLLHRPGYGLPDLSEVYRDVPGSIPVLARAVEEAVGRYEPRLRDVRVEHRRTDPYSMQLVFVLTARLADGAPVRLRTTFRSGEAVRVAARTARQDDGTVAGV